MGATKGLRYRRGARTARSDTSPVHVNHGELSMRTPKIAHPRLVEYVLSFANKCRSAIPPRLLIVLALLGSALCLVFAVILYITGKAPGIFFISDYLFLAALYQDLFVNNGHLDSWYVTPAPYFFPDWPLYFLARYIAGSAYLASPLFFIAQAIIFYALAVSILKKCLSAGFARVWAAIVVSWSLVWGIQGHDPFVFLLTPTYHFGSYILLLVELLLALSLISPAPTRRARLLLFLAFLVAALGVSSDRIFLIQFSLPVVVLFVVRGVLRPRIAIRDTWYVALTSFGGLLGLEIPRLILTHQGEPRLSNVLNYHFPPVEEKLNSLRHLIEAASSHQISTAIALVFYVGTICIFLLMGRGGAGLTSDVSITSSENREEQARRACGVFVIAFALLELIISGVVQILLPWGPAGRYLIPVFFLPLLLTAIPLQIWCERFQGGEVIRKARPFLLIVCAFVSVLPAVKLAVHALHNPGEVQFDYYPEEIKCIDRVAQNHTLRYAIAPYWVAAPIRIFSKIGLNVVQYRSERGHLIPQYHVMSEEWIRDAYDVVITKKVRSHGGLYFDREIIESVGGSPKSVETCGSLQLYVFNPGTFRPGRQK